MAKDKERDKWTKKHDKIISTDKEQWEIYKNKHIRYNMDTDESWIKTSKGIKLNKMDKNEETKKEKKYIKR